MRLYSITRLLALSSLALASAFGSAIPVGQSMTLWGLQMPQVPPSPNNKGPSNFQGTNCTLFQAGCIAAGDPQPYDIFSATITNNGNNNWTVSVQTNAPVGGAPPTFSSLAFGDALFQSGVDSNGTPIYWGLSLGSYTNGLSTQGDLYEEKFLPARGSTQLVASDYPDVYLTAGQAGYPAGRTNEPVWINNQNMNDVGASTGFGVSCWNGSAFVALPTPTCLNGGNMGGTGFYLYTITDSFNAPSSFLSGNNFSFEVASYVCANGLIIGSGSSGVPEPRWLFLIVPAFLLLGRRLAHSRSAVQQ
jgi:hypothetical protein